MIPLPEALAIVLGEAALLPVEEVGLDEALGRVLREDVGADREMPPFDRAAMDGFALLAGDAGDPPAVLSVVAEVRAGQWPERAVGHGEAVRIMTGAPVPAGADAVVPVERTRAAGDRVEVLTQVVPGANIVPRASEARAGDVVLGQGRVIDAAAIAVLASVGQRRPRVARRPTLAVLTTGDEVVPPSDTPARAQIRNCNGPALEALARLAGAEVQSLGVVPDRREAIAAAVERGLGADVFLATGGVSAGEYDLVEPVLIEAGVQLLFTGVAIKPGAPVVFGRRDQTLVFGLPGNPVSAQVTFDLLVRPCLRKMQGARVLAPPRLPVELAAPARNTSERVVHLPARVGREGGRLVARLVRSMGSGDLAAHAKANALLVIEAGRSLDAGETAEALVLGSFQEDDGAPL